MHRMDAQESRFAGTKSVKRFIIDNVLRLVKQTQNCVENCAKFALPTPHHRSTPTITTSARHGQPSSDIGGSECDILPNHLSAEAMRAYSEQLLKAGVWERCVMLTRKDV